VARAALREFHGDLRAADAKLEVLLAYGPRNKEGDLTGPAIKVNRAKCLGSVRLLSLRDRAAGRADFEVTLDGDDLPEWSEERLRAILDHELTHVCVVKDKEGTAKTDDLERPVLRLQPHDKQIGWFDAVAYRHGSDSVEVEQAERLFDDEQFHQLYLPGVSWGGSR